jgi:hypothetical protein
MLSYLSKQLFNMDCYAYSMTARPMDIGVKSILRRLYSSTSIEPVLGKMSRNGYQYVHSVKGRPYITINPMGI